MHADPQKTFEKMKTDIILCGVGGQGILSIATVIGEAATKAGLQLKQAEVHGMSQRGGDVQSHLRLSTDTIWSDLIPSGGADLIISMEPMEALRYLPWLSPSGRIVTASAPLVNIPDYPDIDTIKGELEGLGCATLVDIDALAREAGAPRSSNMALLGAAASRLGIIDPQALLDAIKTVFSSKGEAIVESNIKAFELGCKHHV